MSRLVCRYTLMSNSCLNSFLLVWKDAFVSYWDCSRTFWLPLIRVSLDTFLASLTNASHWLLIWFSRGRAVAVPYYFHVLITDLNCALQDNPNFGLFFNNQSTADTFLELVLKAHLSSWNWFVQVCLLLYLCAFKVYLYWDHVTL